MNPEKQHVCVCLAPCSLPVRIATDVILWKYFFSSIFSLNFFSSSLSLSARLSAPKKSTTSELQAILLCLSNMSATGFIYIFKVR